MFFTKVFTPKKELKETIVIETNLEKIDTYRTMAQQIFENGEQIQFRIKYCSVLDISVPLVPLENSGDLSESACLYCGVCKKILHFSDKGTYTKTYGEYQCTKCIQT